MMFLHGGISPEVPSTSLTTEAMNEKIRTELADPSQLPPGMTTNVEGPMWYRGLAEFDEKQIGAACARRPEDLRRPAVIVGHTVTKTVHHAEIRLERRGGRLRAFALLRPAAACLVIENNSAFTPLPGHQDPFAGAHEGVDFWPISPRPPQPTPAAFTDSKVIDEVKAAPAP